MYSIFSGKWRVTVTANDGALAIVPTAPQSAEGNCQGLLGDFDGIWADDLLLANGTQLDPKAAPEDVYDFGQSCRFISVVYKDKIWQRSYC